MESIAEDAENMDQHSDHEDVRSEHSDQDHDNPPVEHDDGKSTFSFSLLTNKYSDERYCGVCLWVFIQGAYGLQGNLASCWLVVELAHGEPRDPYVIWGMAFTLA